MLKNTKQLGRSSRIVRTLKIIFLFAVTVLVQSMPAEAEGAGTIQADDSKKVVTLVDGQGDLALRLNYDNRCILDEVIVRGREVVAASGVCTGIREHGQSFSTRDIATPVVSARENTLTITGICYGPSGAEIHESWQFTVEPDQILWRIDRDYPRQALLEDTAIPEWDFAGLDTWTGGLLDNGGVVLDKYLETTNCTYGGHFNTVTFWNSRSNDCLRIIPMLPSGRYGAGRFSHETNGVLAFNYVVSDSELIPRHNLSRFLRNEQDLWSPFRIQAQEARVQFTLKSLDYRNSFNRGQLSGLDGMKVGELLDTVARYGVIDRRLTGGNGWRSGYICLHEPFFAEMALALDETDYTANLSRCLDYERDNAVEADGRVLSRWLYSGGDPMSGSIDDATGFFETKWGVLLDSQPDYVINVAEEFNLTGDEHWLAGQKSACEEALDFLIRREIGHTGLVAMMNDSVKQKKSSDWIDVVWAAYENSFVNAALYEALQLWSADEETLGDPERAVAYRDFAARLKASFNRPIADGGFWDPANQWYIYWRDKDGSIHGNNLVTPVNFAAIAYGICDDPSRRTAILERMEREMQKERLFSWPLCFFSFTPEEGGGAPHTFPSYENGDIFLSWNELGVRAYAGFDPAIALKYVKNTLARYDADGLSYQRYLRQSQRGAGDDILAGNCMAVVGLYRDIYGVEPQPNCLYLDPHLPAELNGTEFRYQLRGSSCLIGLNTNNYSMTIDNCTVSDSNAFGLNVTKHQVQYFSGENETWAMAISRPGALPLSIQIESWPPNNEDLARRWTEKSPRAAGKIVHYFNQLRPGAIYKLRIDGRVTATLRADKTGCIKFTCRSELAAPGKFDLAPLTNIDQ